MVMAKKSLFFWICQKKLIMLPPRPGHSEEYSPMKKSIQYQRDIEKLERRLGGKDSTNEH